MHNYVLDMRTVTPHFPGIGRYVRNLAQHMAPQLHEHESLTLLAHSEHPYTLPRTAGDSSKVQTLSTAASPFSPAQQWAIPRLLRQRAASRPGGMLYHSPYYLMPYYVPCPTVLTVYDVIALIHPQAVSVLARTLFRIATMLALRTSAHIITISHATRLDLLAAFNVDPAKVTTVHLAADDMFFPRPVDEQQEVRLSLALPDRYLLYFGINKPHKNLVRLIDAYASVRSGVGADEDEPPTLVIAGAWDKRYPEAKTRAAHHGLAEHVRFLGPIDDADLPALYSAATAFFFPSRYEGFGLPVLEAMACGTPVACGHTSSLPEVAGDAAFYFDADDTDSIAQAIRAVSTDSRLRHTLVEMSLRQSSKFSWSRTAADTVSIYRSMIQPGFGPSLYGHPQRIGIYRALHQAFSRSAARRTGNRRIPK